MGVPMCVLLPNFLLHSILMCVSNLHFNQQHLALSRCTPALCATKPESLALLSTIGRAAAIQPSRRTHDLSPHCHRFVSHCDSTQAGNCDVCWLPVQLNYLAIGRTLLRKATCRGYRYKLIKEQVGFRCLAPMDVWLRTLGIKLSTLFSLESLHPSHIIILLHAKSFLSLAQLVGNLEGQCYGNLLCWIASWPFPWS